MKLVKDVMVSNVACVSPFAKLREALSLMKKHSVKSLVVEKQHPNDAYGLITYTNILKTVVAEEGDIDLLNVYDACAKPALSVGKSLSVRQVAAMMTEHRVKRILVLEDNDLLGFVTMDDIMAVLLEQVE
ncbi:CBS domain-containing protein [Halomonas sp. ISL-60]|uniref:CBS domain-containing protein n=1 Tax=unclassified Halomonas TaxID=2609666 RepID=UPI0007D9FCB5|nr:MULTISPECIES: CBS domain-containing protein [unclassified Halomonas]MBT2774731.1 CBS domain-containing protein [Halomonas sp. ISL-60]MBT2787878.1 CBS domain-containing protein [Halomonas sp. ISL-106]MBT2795627.1 CBS domain-containing protein [Halomonas sp. ISL-104]MBT2802323.1 CBS domain-containing protein [Halomonas sp. ISL-56]OAL60934.1 histidine kinase [Halomonas sp. ALS9]